MQAKVHPLKQTEAMLVADSFTRSEHLGEGAQRHLREGFARRALIVRSSRLRMLDVAYAGRASVLSVEECEELNIQLNSFYFQMRGALDNLAWAIHYHYSLLGATDEDDPDTQRRCYLFGQAFLNALDTKVPVLAAQLRSRLDWAREFKRLRDPAAHRIPLFAVPGVATQQEADEFNTKWQEAMQLIKDGDASAALATAAEADQLGKYEPIFAMSGPAGKEVKRLREQIEADYEAFLQVSRAVIDSMTSEAA